MINRMGDEKEINQLTHRIIDCAMTVHNVQALNYLEGYEIANGLLINFGNTNLQV